MHARIEKSLVDRRMEYEKESAQVIQSLKEENAELKNELDHKNRQLLACGCIHKAIQ